MLRVKIQLWGNLGSSVGKELLPCSTICVKLRFNFQRQLCKLLSEGKCVRVRAIKVAHRYLSAGNEVQALSPNLYLVFRKLNLQKLPDHTGIMYHMYSRSSRSFCLPCDGLATSVVYTHKAYSVRLIKTS